MGILSAITQLLPIATKFITDKDKLAEFQSEILTQANELEKAQLEFEGKVSDNQTKQNEIILQKEGFVHSGWRPSLIWMLICALGIQALLIFTMIVLAMFGIDMSNAVSVLVALSPILIPKLISMLGGLVGLGWLRSNDKKNQLTNAFVSYIDK